MRTDIEGEIRDLVDTLFVNIPSGVGSSRKDLRLGQSEERTVLTRGARWAVERGFGTTQDLKMIEEGGCIQGADPEQISRKAKDRGRPQLGTLGSGNHFVEVGYVEEVFSTEVARTLGLHKDQVTVIVHTGSRGLGHQVCDDHIRVMLDAVRKYNIELPDRQLCCAPVGSPEGRKYMAAMAGAANFAFTNRQMITHWVRETFERILGRGCGLDLVYDVCHNMAKVETHMVDGKRREVCVHRKGATRAFPPGHPEIPEDYQGVGQPVLIPGDMGRYSYVLVGTHKAYETTFGSTCHGAGRVMSRHQAKKVAKGRVITRELEDKGIYVRGASQSTIVEEISEAYKDVDDVVRVVGGAGISQKVVRLRPLGVIKG
jgi:tRNA-splicing ligase RtcB